MQIMLSETISIKIEFQTVFFSPSPMPPPVLVNLMVFPPGCGYSVADFWGWDAHEGEEVSGDMCED